MPWQRGGTRSVLLVLQRRNPRPGLKDADRRYWILVCRCFIEWRTSLLIVKPERVAMAPSRVADTPRYCPGSHTVQIASGQRDRRALGAIGQDRVPGPRVHIQSAASAEGLGRVCRLFQQLAPASFDWTTCALRGRDTCVSSEQSSWKNHRHTCAWRPPSRLSAGRMIFRIDILRPTTLSPASQAVDRHGQTRTE